MDLTKILLATSPSKQMQMIVVTDYTCLFADLFAKDGNHNLLVRTEIDLKMSSYSTKILKSILMQEIM